MPGKDILSKQLPKLVIIEGGVKVGRVSEENMIK